MARGKCPDTGKTIYTDRRDARVALGELAKRRPGKCEQSAYNCKFCGKWHITCIATNQKTPRPTRMAPNQRWRWNRSEEE